MSVFSFFIFILIFVLAHCPVPPHHHFRTPQFHVGRWVYIAGQDGNPGELGKLSAVVRSSFNSLFTLLFLFIVTNNDIECESDS